MHITVNLQQAHNAFISAIDAAYQHPIDPAVLEDVYQEKCDRLDQDMHVLKQLAVEGMEEQLSPQLTILLEEWAIKEAVELLLRYQNSSIDPSHRGLQQSFWEKLGRQHQTLSSELFLLLQQGKERRARLREESAQSWEGVASRAIANQQQQQQHWQNTASQWVQGQQQMNQQWFQQQQHLLNQCQASNQQWAHTALTGVQQAQLGMKQWYDFAAGTQQHVTTMLAATEQRHSVLVEQAVQKVNQKKWTTRIIIISLILIGVVALFGYSFFAMLHPY